MQTPHKSHRELDVVIQQEKPELTSKHVCLHSMKMCELSDLTVYRSSLNLLNQTMKLLILPILTNSLPVPVILLSFTL